MPADRSTKMILTAASGNAMYLALLHSNIYATSLSPSLNNSLGFCHNAAAQLTEVDTTTNSDWFKVQQDSNADSAMKHALHKGSMEARLHSAPLLFTPIWLLQSPRSLPG